jgi:hypothetical protein
LILAIVLRNYSTKLCYIFQLKRELKVWKYIFNLFHFEMLIQNRNPKFRPLCLDYKLSLFIFSFFFVSSCFVYYYTPTRRVVGILEYPRPFVRP